MPQVERRVLIVGAGPTGLVAKACLRRFGIRCDIVDRKSGPSSDSKALAINPFSNLQLAILGLANTVGTQAQKIGRLEVWWKDRRLNSVDLRWLDCEQNFFLVQPQQQTEIDLVRSLGSDAIQWGVEIQRISPTLSGCLVNLRDATGAFVEREYDYLVGCDGKRSKTREVIGASLSETTFGAHLLLGDFELNAPWSDDRVHYRLYEDTFFVLVPLGNGMWRAVVMCAEGVPEPAHVPQRIVEALEAKLGKGIVRSAARWSSTARLYNSVASKLRAGSIFLAGDAAHLYSPIGGTGMNTGIQDALNFAWKLAFVLKGWSSPALLDTYEEERLPAIRANAAAAEASTRLITGRARAPEDIAPFIPGVRNRAALARLPSLFSGFGGHYAIRSSATRTTCEVPVGAISGGLAAVVRKLARDSPDVPVFIVLMFVGNGERGGKMESLAHATCREGVRPVAVAMQGTQVPFAVCAPIVTVDACTWRRLGGREGEVQVIRPDGVVSYRDSIDNVAGVIAHLATWLM